MRSSPTTPSAPDACTMALGSCRDFTSHTCSILVILPRSGVLASNDRHINTCFYSFSTAASWPTHNASTNRPHLHRSSGNERSMTPSKPISFLRIFVIVIRRSHATLTKLPVRSFTFIECSRLTVSCAVIIAIVIAFLRWNGVQLQQKLIPNLCFNL